MDKHQGETPPEDIPLFDSSNSPGKIQQGIQILEDEFPVKAARQGRRRTSSTSSVASTASFISTNMNNFFDSNTPIEVLLASLRKIINSTSGPASKQRHKLTVGLLEAGNAILDQLDKRTPKFSTPAPTENRKTQTCSTVNEKQQEILSEDSTPPRERSHPDPPLE
ncbi:hypothetical protein AVEN_111436-1 [Araneus ventricosus]|uniref:Uncharacterized protein n=1 Tax=Araneus ventricosus TaxID=182803 RepID=A0A4Y2K0N8_ARAVE|nr:hypothetical protein AVEN_111436-1 [Araneus ventricosus]